VAKLLDYTSRLGELDAPVLVLCGRHDPQYPPACSAQLAAGIRGARLRYFERCGHYPFIEEPQAFWAGVDAFLTRDASAAAATGNGSTR
jgi:pimeloyl-ACP methyl ester carboxylesterase